MRVRAAHGVRMGRAARDARRAVGGTTRRGRSPSVCCQTAAHAVTQGCCFLRFLVVHRRTRSPLRKRLFRRADDREREVGLRAMRKRRLHRAAASNGDAGFGAQPRTEPPQPFAKFGAADQGPRKRLPLRKRGRQHPGNRCCCFAKKPQPQGRGLPVSAISSRSLTACAQRGRDCDPRHQ